MHWAVERGHMEAVKLLLDYEASPLIAECSGRTPLFLAAKRNDVAMLDQLAAAMGPDAVAEMVNRADNSGITPMSLCRENMEEHQESFRWLLSHGAVYESHGGVHKKLAAGTLAA